MLPRHRHAVTKRRFHARGVTDVAACFACRPALPIGSLRWPASRWNRSGCRCPWGRPYRTGIFRLQDSPIHDRHRERRSSTSPPHLAAPHHSDEELPLNGATGRTLACCRRDQVTSSGQRIAAEGAGTYQVNVDGQQITYEGGGLGNVQARYSRDAIAEFEYISNRFDASQGRSQGVQINAVTKSGTNNYNGSFGAYFRDDKLNAADHIVGYVLPYSNQQVSATHGGLRRESTLLLKTSERQDYRTVSRRRSRNQPAVHGARESKRRPAIGTISSAQLRLRGWGAWQTTAIDRASGQLARSSVVMSYIREQRSVPVKFTQSSATGREQSPHGYAACATSRNRRRGRSIRGATDGIVNGSPISVQAPFGRRKLPRRAAGQLACRRITVSYNARGRHDMKIGRYIKIRLADDLPRRTASTRGLGRFRPTCVEFPSVERPGEGTSTRLRHRRLAGIGEFHLAVDRHQKRLGPGDWRRPG